MADFWELPGVFPSGMRELFSAADTGSFPVEELRLRSGQPVLMKAGGSEWFLGLETGQWEQCGGSEAKVVRVTEQDIHDTLEAMSRYSLYAFEEELRQGFLTIPGGHRVGLAGQIVLEGGRVKTIRQISFLNIRIAREIQDCAKPLLPWIFEKNRLQSTLIVSPPGCGKTTLLRDLIRLISSGWWEEEQGKRRWISGENVGVVDERSELGACVRGVPQNDLGPRADVLDGCPKAEGIQMLIRSMGPQVIAVDEIGGLEDLTAIRYGRNCGCALLATVHGTSYEDIRQKPVLHELLLERTFGRIVLLRSGGRPGQLQEIRKEDGEVLV